MKNENEKNGRKLGVFVYLHYFNNLKGVFSFDFNTSITRNDCSGNDSLF